MSDWLSEKPMMAFMVLSLCGGVFVSILMSLRSYSRDIRDYGDHDDER